MPRQKQKNIAPVCDWLKHSSLPGVVDIHKTFTFKDSGDSIKFITYVMEIDHVAHDCMIESIMNNNVVEVAIMSIKEDLTEHLMELVENIYKKWL